MKNLEKKISIIFIFILIITTLFTPYANGPAIRSDGYGYSVWAKKISNPDYEMCNDPDLKNIGAIRLENELGTKCVNKYPPGVGIFQSPFFAIFKSIKSQSVFTKLDHFMVLTIGASLLFISCFLIHKINLSSGISKEISLISLLAFLFGGGLFHHGTYEASFSHIYSVFGYTIGLFLVKRIKDKRINRIYYPLIFIVSIWLNLVRITNVLLTFSIFVIGVMNVKEPNSNIYFNKKQLKLLTTFIFSTFISFIFSFIYTYLMLGNFTINTYGQESNSIFADFGKHFFDVLISFDGGLFPYYPVFLLTLFLFIVSRKTIVGYLFFGLVILYAIIYGSWESWYLGGGFGHRGFIDVIPLGVISLAESIDNFNKYKRRIIFFIVGVCIYINTSMMIDYWAGEFPFDAEKKYFIRSVIKFNWLSSLMNKLF